MCFRIKSFFFGQTSMGQICAYIAKLITSWIRTFWVLFQLFLNSSSSCYCGILTVAWLPRSKYGKLSEHKWILGSTMESRSSRTSVRCSTPTSGRPQRSPSPLSPTKIRCRVEFEPKLVTFEFQPNWGKEGAGPAEQQVGRLHWESSKPRAREWPAWAAGNEW